MPMTLNQKAWERLIAEDIGWLDQQPDTLECKHIRLILEWARSHKASFEHENGGDIQCEYPVPQPRTKARSLTERKDNV